MAKGKTLCNVCGKEFSDYDEQEHIQIMRLIKNIRLIIGLKEILKFVENRP